MTTTQRVVLAGEIRCKGVFENGEWADGALDEIEQVVRRTVREIGYEQDGFHWETLIFENNLHAQSVEIAQGVDAGAKDRTRTKAPAIRASCSVSPATKRPI